MSGASHLVEGEALWSLALISLSETETHTRHSTDSFSAPEESNVFLFSGVTMVTSREGKAANLTRCITDHQHVNHRTARSDAQPSMPRCSKTLAQIW